MKKLLLHHRTLLIALVSDGNHENTIFTVAKSLCYAMFHRLKANKIPMEMSQTCYVTKGTCHSLHAFKKAKKRNGHGLRMRKERRDSKCEEKGNRTMPTDFSMKRKVGHYSAHYNVIAFAHSSSNGEDSRVA